MKFNYALVMFAFVSSQAFGVGFWADSNFPQKLISRYPAYRTKITTLNNEINNSFKIIAKDPGNRAAQALLASKSKEFADVICEAARNEIKEQIEESEFEKI